MCEPVRKTLSKKSTGDGELHPGSWQDPSISLLRLLFNVNGKTPQIWLMLHTNVDEFGSQNDLCPILSGDGNGCLQQSLILCVDRFEEGTLVTLISR